jgi:hypothetical protein
MLAAITIGIFAFLSLLSESVTNKIHTNVVSTEDKLRVFECRVLKKIFGCKGDNLFIYLFNAPGT